MEKIISTSKHASEVVWEMINELAVFILAGVSYIKAKDSGRSVKIALLAIAAIAIANIIYKRYKHETDK